jgi:hypothetical protein
MNYVTSYDQFVVEEKKLPFSFLGFFCYAIASATTEWFSAIFHRVQFIFFPFKMKI